jgi:hypothetical protein
MSPKQKVKATKLTVGLPFNLGSLELQNDEAQQRAAWAMYVELSTRISTVPLEEGTGILREALASLYKVFDITRQILREAGPGIAKGPKSLGAIAIDVLNIGLRPFLVKWHPMLKAYEEKKPADLTSVDHERKWERAADMRTELEQVRQQMVIYVDALAKIAGVDKED